METIVKDFFTLYGPLGLGWVFAIYLLRELRITNKKLMELYGTAAGQISALNTLLQERLPRQHDRQP